MQHANKTSQETDAARPTPTPTTAPAPGTATGVDDAPQRVTVKRLFGTGGFGYPPNRSRVDDLLRDEDRPGYEDLLTRGTSVPRLMAWLGERGYDFGRSAVANHRMKWMRDFDYVRKGSEIGVHFAKFARAAGLSLSEAAVGGMHQMLMQFFTRRHKSGQLTGKDMDALASSCARFIESERKVADVRRELDTARGANVEPGAVVDRVREILGV
jgi:hypothetical protein